MSDHPRRRSAQKASDKISHSLSQSESDSDDSTHDQTSGEEEDALEVCDVSSSDSSNNSDDDCPDSGDEVHTDTSVKRLIFYILRHASVNGI